MHKPKTELNKSKTTNAFRQQWMDLHVGGYSTACITIGGVGGATIIPICSILDPTTGLD